MRALLIVLSSIVFASSALAADTWEEFIAYNTKAITIKNGDARDLKQLQSRACEISASPKKIDPVCQEAYDTMIAVREAEKRVLGLMNKIADQVPDKRDDAIEGINAAYGEMNAMASKIRRTIIATFPSRQAAPTKPSSSVERSSKTVGLK